ncbi:nucleotide-diphospho-sugar transferase [Jimgerdemannia flammicorona]|uniref:Nucleotide-diphospho-sugar transferase n=1 Tax=Jimgerdemannia flammicorona TaxID=994334 RepID=A0A433DLI9_9FUNG|nr:nucleotide-diphospho-sugar transferase [Jimgerdemannia flammicorona]
MVFSLRITFRIFLLLLCTITTISYTVLRAQYTIDQRTPARIWYTTLVVFLELVNGVAFLLMLLERVRSNASPGLPIPSSKRVPGDVQRSSSSTLKATDLNEVADKSNIDAVWPTVTILITCCGEDPEVIRGTVLAAQRVRYPVASKVQVYLCDDGKNLDGIPLRVDDLLPIVLDPSAFSTVRAPPIYIRRKKTPSVPHHAKAGNLNHALKCTPYSDFVAVFDADMQCDPDFLLETVSRLCEDKQAAFVQTPQSFTNAEESSARDPLDTISRVYYNVILPGWAAWGCTPCAGTNFLMRRAAIDSIGGFPTGCVTEDYLMSMKLHGKGWTSLYLNKVLARGLAPENIKDLFRQRSRWAKGNLQIWFNHNPIIEPGLTPIQRLLYMSVGVGYLNSALLVFWMVIPIFHLITGILPIFLQDTWMAYIIVAQLLFTQVAGIFLSIPSGGDQFTEHLLSFWSSSQFAWMFQYYHAKATIVSFLGRDLSFKVSDKGGLQRSHVSASLRLTWFNLVVSVIMLAALAYRIVLLTIKAKNTGLNPQDVQYLLSAVFILNIICVQSQVVFLAIKDNILRGCSHIFVLVWQNLSLFGVGAALCILAKLVGFSDV